MQRFREPLHVFGGSRNDIVRQRILIGGSLRQGVPLSGIGFKDIVFQIERGDLLDILEHSNPGPHPGPRIFVVRREKYVYLVPCVEDEHTILLKTNIPSRKATKEYLGEEDGDEA
jgi:hypothetical protein